MHRILWQEEDRDSSDEEWDAAYAALDPIAQLGWRNRSGGVNAVGADLLRDVFAAADEMHENAMSEVEGNTPMEEEDREERSGAGEASTSHGREGNMESVDSVELGLEGEAPC